MTHTHTWQAVLTADGSPSLRLLEKDGSCGETMHSTKGAFSETRYVYSPAIEMCLESFSDVKSPNFLSVGLGLGYVEMAIASEVLKRNLQNCFLRSFEIDTDLTAQIQSWCRSNENFQIYSSIAQLFEQELCLLPGSIQRFLGHQLKTSQWTFFVDLRDFKHITEKFHCILFDAFSQTQEKEVWEKGFLCEFIDHLAAERCVFATYASTSILKGILESRGFRNLNRPGFAGKRECTLQVRT